MTAIQIQSEIVKVTYGRLCVMVHKPTDDDHGDHPFSWCCRKESG